MSGLAESNTLPDTSASSGNTNLSPDGGNVSITVGGTITTTGANAHGVVAQSVGGGGGIAGGCASCQPNAWVVAGDSAQIYNITPGQYAGQGGAITIVQTGGRIETSGPGSIAIFAQSTGKSDHTSPISITIGGTVIGGTVIGGTNTGATSGGVGAAGIVLTGGILPGSSMPSGVTSNQITVNAGGSVSTEDGAAGNAIITGYGLTNVTNAGTITGSMNLGSAPGTIVNNQGGVLNTGSSIVASSLTNNGTLNVMGAGVIGTTNLTGSFAQTSGGTLAVDVNPLAGQKQGNRIWNALDIRLRACPARA